MAAKAGTGLVVFPTLVTIECQAVSHVFQSMVATGYLQIAHWVGFRAVASGTQTTHIILNKGGICIPNSTTEVVDSS